MSVDVPPASTRSRLFSALRELGLVAILFLVYKIGRIAATGHVDEAFDNADRVWRLERWLHLPGELSVQHRLMSWHWLIEVANSYYAYVHFPATAASLIWLYVYRPAHYRWTRNVLALLTGAALLVHFGFPLAPPRMLTDSGMLDLGRLFGPAVYGAPETDQLSNQYAAMPSLHVGWAVVVAVALITATSARWRGLWLLHPVITLLVVVGTGNHYWVDAIAALALLAVAYVLMRPFYPGTPSADAVIVADSAVADAAVAAGAGRAAVAAGLGRGMSAGLTAGAALAAGTLAAARAALAADPGQGSGEAPAIEAIPAADSTAVPRPRGPIDVPALRR